MSGSVRLNGLRGRWCSAAVGRRAGEGEADARRRAHREADAQARAREGRRRLVEEFAQGLRGARSMRRAQGCQRDVQLAVADADVARGGLMQRLLLRYTQALLTEMFQIAACNRHHSIEQQLCRWLLLILDRLPSNELIMTQELVASALGVRREGITEAAGNLQRAGLIRYRRGHIAVLGRPGLQAGACECYAVLKKESSRLLSAVRYRQSASAIAI